MNAVGYLRVSADEPDSHQQSPEDYKRVIREHCERHEFTLLNVFEDINVSGGIPHLRRPGFAEMWSRRNEYQVVVVPNGSRFGRDAYENEGMRREMRKARITLHDASMMIDERTSGGRMTRGVVDLADQNHRDNTGEAMRRQLWTRAEQGRWTGGANTPYGFLYDNTDPANRNIRPDPESADVVRWIYKMYAEGKSARWIAQDLSARGVPNVRKLIIRDKNTGAIEERTSRSDGAGTWWTPNVTRILDSPTYAPHPDNPQRGILRRHVWEGMHSAAKGGDRTRTDKFVDFVGQWEPIVDADTAAAVRDRRESKRADVVAVDVTVRKTGKQHRVGVGGNTGNGTYLLSGLIVCSECGRNLNHQPKKTRRPAMYSCVPAAKGSMRTVCHCGGVSEGRADKEVSGRFLEMIEPARLRGIMDNLSHERRNGAEYDRELASIDRRMEQLVMQLADAGTGQARAVQSAIGKLEDKRVKVEQARDSAKQAVEQQATEARDVSGLIELLHKHTPGLAETQWTTDVLEEVWYSLTIERRRHLLSRAIERVELVPGEVGYTTDKHGRERRYNKTTKQLRIVFKDWVREAV